MGDGPNYLERVAFPDTLLARVCEGRVRSRLHGYDVEADLARHYSFAETIVLALTGVAPSAEQGRAAEAAFVFWLPSFVGEAPTHVAVLANVCSTPTSGTVAASAVTLSEQSRWVVSQHHDLLTWLERPSTEYPVAHQSTDEVDREAVLRLQAAVGAFAGEVVALRHRPTRTAAVLATLWAVGLNSAQHLEVALTIARLPGTLAEGLAGTRGKLKEYPMNVPRFAYHE
ncbi:MAG: hypothetical protein JNG84_04900 [Archangium sp.]|nr:hypothetical protein [Archangium sp.]